jgi:hypothetical protein
MKRYFKVLILVIVLFLNNQIFFAQDISAGRKEGQWVYDYANILPENIRQSIESDISMLEQLTTAEVFVVTVNDTGSESMENYSLNLLNDWEIGKEEINNGVLLFYDKSQEDIYIVTGFGMESIITDEIVDQIIDNNIYPLFDKNDFAGGIKSGFTEIYKIILKNPYEAKGVNHVKIKNDNINIFDEKIIIGNVDKYTTLDKLEEKSDRVKVTFRVWINQKDCKIIYKKGSNEDIDFVQIKNDKSKVFDAYNSEESSGFLNKNFKYKYLDEYDDWIRIQVIGWVQKKDVN